MEFNEKLPEWENSGTEPSETLKKDGFAGGYKPPASIFNWFWNRVSACLKEIRENLSNVSNVADSEKHVKYAQTSGKANQLLYSLIVRFKGGDTEGTDKWTFDGSTSRSVNITAKKIGAAEENHEHLFERGVTTAGTGAAYTAQVEGITALEAGLSFIMIPHVQSTTSMPTLDVNGLGAKNLRQPLTLNTAATTAAKLDNWLTAGKPVVVLYDGTQWKTISLLRTSATSLYGTVPIESGGTGATNAPQALFNLGAAPTNHSHSSNGISSLIRNYHSDSSGGDSFAILVGAGGNGHLSAGMWLITATNYAKCSLYFFENTSGNNGEIEYAFSDVKLPALFFVAQDTVERTVVIDVINGKVATAELGTDGTTYDFNRTSLRTGT